MPSFKASNFWKLGDDFGPNSWCSNAMLIIKIFLLFNLRVVLGGARGGLGGYSTPLEHASPPLEGESNSFRDVWHL